MGVEKYRSDISPGPAFVCSKALCLSVKSLQHRMLAPLVIRGMQDQKPPSLFCLCNHAVAASLPDGIFFCCPGTFEPAGIRPGKPMAYPLSLQLEKSIPSLLSLL